MIRSRANLNSATSLPRMFMSFSSVTYFSSLSHPWICASIISLFGYVHRFAKTSISFEFIILVRLLLPSSLMYAILQWLCECISPSVLWPLPHIHNRFFVQAFYPDVNIKYYRHTLDDLFMHGCYCLNWSIGIAREISIDIYRLVSIFQLIQS